MKKDATKVSKNRAHGAGEGYVLPSPLISEKLLSPEIRFSFIMPVYGRTMGEYNNVNRACHSLQSQTDPRWDALVVNDGRDPSMRAIVEGLEDFRVRYFEAPYRGMRGGHQSVNYVKEFLQRHSQFTCILNGDNVVRPEYVEKMYSADHDVLTCMVKFNDMPGIVMDGTGFMRGRTDRLNYAIRSSVVRRTTHKLHLDADYDFLMDAIALVEKEQKDVKIHYCFEILGEHN